MSNSFSNDTWDFYSCEIDGKPYSTMVNLSLFDVAPIQSLSMFCCVEVTLKYPDPKHGMTTNQEYQTLCDMEDLIDQNQTMSLKYIARQTGDGKRKFYFYCNSETDPSSLFDRMNQAFPAYEKSNFNFEDAEWRTYFENLYPNAIAMNEIKNRAVLRQLEESGDDLSIPRTIDHSVVFKNEKQAKEFEKIVKQKGFTVEVNTRGFFKKTFDLFVQRVDPPSSIDPITLELEELAKELGGTYDGWGCIQVASTN